MHSPLNLANWITLWRESWRGLGAEGRVPVLTELLAAWGEPHRHYHDQRHLGECLARWSRWRSQAEQPGEVALALWFHDAVYEPRASDNEIRSAAWAARVMTEAGVDVGAVQRVHDLIMDTCHEAVPTTADAQLVVDIDLAVLGAEEERFEAFDRDVRKEYGWVPGFLYRRKRRDVLQRFLDRERIYSTPAAFEELEVPARRNLAAALSRLAQ
jgi:predicted metal-dependent HD superfamily phosphohydrolase